MLLCKDLCVQKEWMVCVVMFVACVKSVLTHYFDGKQKLGFFYDSLKMVT